jgi:hypothetical protein
LPWHSSTLWDVSYLWPDSRPWNGAFLASDSIGVNTWVDPE